MPSLLAKQISSLPEPTTRYPLWAGPTTDGPNGGITQSMLQRYLACRERFRIRYVEGLAPPQRWEKTFGYGNMWHACEEALAGNKSWQEALDDYTHKDMKDNPLQREEIAKWWNVCRVQFPEYIKYWQDHPDLQDRKPLMQEYPFDVRYKLATGREVRLRGKFDSVDLIPSQGGIYLQENKTRGMIDEAEVRSHLKFDLQTLFYLVALKELARKEGT